jgi:hypothetical protein
VIRPYGEHADVLGEGSVVWCGAIRSINPVEQDPVNSMLMAGTVSSW